jgi:uncharacterized protein (TIGR02284 family)
MHTEQQMDTLNELLRGEIAAVETYQQAMAKVDSDPGAVELRQLHDEHRAAANLLRQHIRGHDGTPDHGSGVWGAWAKAVEGVAKLFGNTLALKALKEGEEHGIKQYEDALKEESLPRECRDLIRSQLLPRTRSHITVLNRLIEAQ